MTKIKSIVFGFSLWGLSAFGATVQQTAQFHNVTPKRLYDLYLDSKSHTEFTNFGKDLGVTVFPAEIDPKVGGDFKAFINFPQPGAIGIVGKILYLDPGTRNEDQYVIVQSWKGGHEGPTDLDTIVTLTFRKIVALLGEGTEIQIVQVNVPGNLLDITNTSWNVRYWEPLTAYLKR